jgi:UDP-N-acetylglucosamine/UDP-N-acetylgalactosamine diphosphorylase
LFETLREEEFSPLKNATGDDSPDSARKMLKALNKKWVIEAGITL